MNAYFSTENGSIITVVDKGAHVCFCLPEAANPSTILDQVPEAYRKAVSKPLPFAEWEVYVLTLTTTPDTIKEALK
jgi:hypothetical protein